LGRDSEHERSLQKNVRQIKLRPGKFIFKTHMSPSRRSTPALPLHGPSFLPSNPTQPMPDDPTPTPFTARPVSPPKQPRDEHPLDLRGPLADLIHLHIPPIPRHGVVLHEPIPPMDLHRVVRRPLRSLPRIQLRHRSEHPHLITRLSSLPPIRR